MPRLALVLALFLAFAGNASAQPKPAVDLEVVMKGVFPPSPIRAEQEQLLLALIADTGSAGDAEELADYYSRLADLYLAQHRDAKARSDAKSQQETKAFLIKGVKTYRALVDNPRFASFPRLDRSLFLFGYLLYSGKYMKEARAAFDQLLKNFPTSSFVPDAHLVMAEYFFEQNQLADAEAFYQRVQTFPKSGAYAYAVYKLGFVKLALDKKSEAAPLFEDAARSAMAPELQRAALDASCKLQAARGVGVAANDRPDLEGAAKGKAVKLVPLSACEEADLVSQGVAAETMAEDASIEARIAVASRYRVAGRFEAAVPLLIAVVEKYPMNGGTELAATLLLDTLVRQKEYDRVLEWVDRFANDKPFLDARPELQKAIKFLRSRSLRRR